MTLDADAYRTLGLARGASLDEVKRAYRRLAKTNHPDAAGAGALPRFLAIQAAYEQLVEGKASGNGRSAHAPRRPWDADPDRGDATRRAYGSRARPASPGPGGPSTSGPSWSARTRTSARENAPGSGAADAGRPSADAAGGGADRPPGTGSGRPSADGPRGAGARDSGPTTGPRGRSERPSKKATLGSTSYDGVDGPFEPDWRGASWYGTTSGTYWTLNPKEYADPRKHGPEYQARARRPARPWPPGSPVDRSVPAADTAADPAAPADPPPAEPVGPPPAEPVGPAARPTHTTTSWWESTAGRGADPDAGYGPDPGPAADAAASRPRSTGRAQPDQPAATPPPDLGRAMADIVRALTDTDYGGWRGRVGRAVIGWLPIALGLGWFIGEVTGCGRFAATCDGSAGPISLALQLAVFAVLLGVPVLASLATMASLTVVAASVLAALILSATGSAADGDSRRAALGVVLLVAWLGGLAVAIWRRWGTAPAPTRPVS